MTTIRMKNKTLSKIHLDAKGQMVVSPVQAASDLASKGISAQPEGPLTEEANLGNPGTPPHTSSSLAGTEVGTGAPAERVDPSPKEELPDVAPEEPEEEVPEEEEV